MFIFAFSEDLLGNNRKVTLLHKELLEINLTITAYIEEIKKRLKGLRLELANEQNLSTQKVVEILSDKCKFLFIANTNLKFSN